MSEVRLDLASSGIHTRKSRFVGEAFNELRERPVRRMLTVRRSSDLGSCATHLRVAIVLLTQTGGERTARGSHCVGSN